MREILFKGKRIDNGEWVEGYYYKISETTYCFKEDYERKPVPEHHYILQERMTDWGLPNQMVQIEIDPLTVLASSRGRLTRTVRGSGRAMLFGLFMMGKNIFIR